MDVSTVTSMPATILTAAIGQGDGGAARVAQGAPAVPATPIPSKAANSTPTDTQQTPSPDDIEKNIKRLNDSFAQNGVSLYASYEKDKITGIEVFQLKDKNTDEVIRQIPSKEMLAIAQSLELPQGWRGQLIYDRS
jgi:flagellar protein FlaG